MKVHAHNPTSLSLRHALRSTLPYSINLTYRTQHPNRTEHAHILATFPEYQDVAEPELPHCWAAAYLDRSSRPETELWLFATGELPGHDESTSTPRNGIYDKEKFCPTCRDAVISLLSYMSTLPIPPIHPANSKALRIAKQHEQEYPEAGPDAQYPKTAASYLRHLLLPHVVTLGAVHKGIAKICLEANLICPQFPGLESELNKWIFRINDMADAPPLPEGLRWGEMTAADTEIVQARTPIPRPTHTLLSLQHVAIFEEATGKPIAWSFLGLDGALSTLHVEPEHRGRGMAKAITSKIMKNYAHGLAVDSQGNAWGHADVYIGNLQSEAVCKSMGGKPMWNTFWVRIDIARAKGGQENKQGI